MATAGLKRSSSSDLDPHSDISSPFWPSNKRHCTTNYSPLNKRQCTTSSPPPNKRHCTIEHHAPPNNLQLNQIEHHRQQQQQLTNNQHEHQQQHQHQPAPFRDPSQSDEANTMIKNEVGDDPHTHVSCDSLLHESDQQDFALIEHIFR